MTFRIPRNRAVRLASWTALAAAAAVTAAAIPAPVLPRLAAPRQAAPTTPTPARPAAVPADTGVLQLSDVDQQPEITNRDAASRLLEEGYPPLLRAAGVQGSVVVSMVVGEDGVPRAPAVVSASHDAFREPALAAASRMRFRPAKKAGHAVAVRLSLPIAFQLSSEAAPPVPPRAPVAAAPADPSGVLQLAEVDEQPAIVNREAVFRVLEQGYPPLLKAAGVEGQVVVSMVVGTDGGTHAARVVSASHDAFREPALAAVSRMRFRPATKGGHAVAVRLSLPIHFQLSRPALRPDVVLRGG